MIKTPTKYFFTCGAAESVTRQNALDGAKLAAGVGSLSLLTASALLPPDCHLCEPRQLTSGTLVPAVTAAIASDIPGEIISAAVAVAWPTDTRQGAVVMEYAARGHKEDVEGIARRMAEEGLRIRGLGVRQLHSIAVQHRVQEIGAAVAYLILC